MTEQDGPKLPAKVAMEYAGVRILFNDKMLVNLTQMWEAAGRPENKDPRQWRRKEGKGFIADLARSLDVPAGHIASATKGGKGGGGDTHAHWQAAVAYAKSLSHEFHRFVNQAFREWADEKADNELKLARVHDSWRAEGKTDEWIAARQDSILQRKQFASALKDHGVKGDGFGDCTKAITIKALGHTPREFKAANNLPKSARTRDHYSEVQLAGIRFAEALAAERLKAERAHGNAECAKVCARAGEAVGAAMKSMAG
jgi:hypothetical protein